MSDRDGLLAAILAHPDEDTPRLAYADWLDEHGDPERAEFIRVQIELARLRFGSPEYARRHQVLGARERELLERHGRKWAAELGLPIAAHSLLFRRGFPGVFVSPLADFLAIGASLVEAAPLECVRFLGPDPLELTRLATFPPFRRIPGIAFNLLDTDPPVVATLLRSLPVEHLRAITLTTTAVRQTGADWSARNAGLGFQFAACPHLNGLKRLRLRGVGLGDEGAANFLWAPNLTGLELLDLSHNDIGEEEATNPRGKFGDALVLDDADRTRFTLDQLGRED